MDPRDRLLQKLGVSRRVADAAGALLWGAVPYVGSVANAAGGAAGLLAPPKDPGDLAKGSEASVLAPGVGAFNAGAVDKAVAGDYKRRSGRPSALYHEVAGSVLGSLLSGAAGAGLGLHLERRSGGKGYKGALIGAASGAALPLAIAMVAAAITPTRSTAEQDAAERMGTADLLVPGLGAYNRWKRRGHGYARFVEKTLPSA